LSEQALVVQQRSNAHSCPEEHRCWPECAPDSGRYRAAAEPQPLHDAFGAHPAAAAMVLVASRARRTRSSCSASAASRGDCASTRSGVPYTTVTRANGFGIMNRSHDLRNHARLAPTVAGIIARDARCAMMRAPGATLWRGPRGPSTVIA